MALTATTLLLVVTQTTATLATPAIKELPAAALLSTHKESDGILISVSLPRETRVGESLWIQIDIVNKDRVFVAAYETARASMFRLSLMKVLRDKRELVPLTRYGHWVLQRSSRGRNSGGYVTHRILRGYGLRYRLNLPILYDLSESAYYELSIWTKAVYEPKGIKCPSFEGLRFKRTAGGVHTDLIKADGTVVQDSFDYQQRYKKIREAYYEKMKREQK